MTAAICDTSLDCFLFFFFRYAIRMPKLYQIITIHSPSELLQQVISKATTHPISTSPRSTRRKKSTWSACLAFSVTSESLAFRGNDNVTLRPLGKARWSEPEAGEPEHMCGLMYICRCWKQWNKASQFSHINSLCLILEVLNTLYGICKSKAQTRHLTLIHFASVN